MPVYKNHIHSKLPHIGTTIFTVMSKLATEHQAINLSQGFPDFDCDRVLIDLVYEHMKNGRNQYAPMQGLPYLREVIANKYKQLYNVNYNPETEITITSGGTQALYTAISAFIHEDDEVIIFTPAYDSYEPAVAMHNGVAKYVELKAPDYSIDWTAVKKLVNHRTKMIIINSPHNPTGSALTKNDLKELDKITRNSEILILSDEVYEHIIFDGQPHQSVCLFPNLAERSFIVASFGKVFHVTGWKMGYCLAPENLMAEFRKAHQFQVFCSNAPMQWALADYLADEKNYMQLSQFYQEKRDYFIRGLSGSRFKFKPAAGTYFQLLDYSAITNEADTDFAVRLTKEKKIASIPVSVFYNTKNTDHMLRFCFAKKKETLDKALDILQKV